MSAISPKGAGIVVADQLSAVGQRIQQGQDFIRTRMDKNLHTTGIQTQTPNELHLRLDTLEHSHAGVFERVDRMTFFAEQVSQLITTLCTDIEDELAKSPSYKTHPDRIQRQILKSQEQAQTMQTAARKCEADLRQVYADVAALLEHSGVPDGPTYPQAASSQRAQPVSSPARDVVNAAVALISWVSQMIGRVTMSAARRAGFLRRNQTGARDAERRVPFRQQESISTVEDDRRKCVECVEELRRWWEGAGVIATQLAGIRTKAGLQDLRERWAAKDRDLKVFEEKLAILMHKPTSQATREAAMKNRQALGLQTADVLG